MKKLILLINFIALSLFVQGQAPTITNFTPSIGTVGTLISITGTNLSNPTAITIGGVAAIPISNDGTTLVAMVMPAATTGGISLTTAGGTANGTGNFTVTATQFPNTQQGNKLVGTGATGVALQGYSVSISADGNTSIVGGRNDDSNAGAAWVYTRNGSTWTQQDKLVGTGATGAAYQGTSVSISADGNTAIVGGFADNNFAGAAWVYTRSGGAWIQQGNKLVGTGVIGVAAQGVSVNISADGNTAIVGGFADNNAAGAAWVYTRSGSTWTQQGNKLVGTGATGAARQGTSVSISADGSTAIFGGYADNNSAGAAWIYTRSGSTWTQQGNKLVGTGATGNAEQGSSVSISADGNTAIVGGSADNSNAGAAWIFTRSGSTWAQQGNKLVGTGVSGVGYQGNSVSISADGNTAIVGGYADNNSAGAAWVYTRSGAAWAQQGNKLVGTGATGNALQGQSVSISADGNTAILGSPNDDNAAGAAWVYNYVPSPLPVSLNNYNAKLQTDGTVLLTWNTFSEQNNDCFQLSRSTDGKNFAVINTIKGKGTTTQRSLYNYTDKTPKSGENYYKLVQVDLDGTRTEKGIRVVNFNFTESSNITVYPNPSSSTLNVEFEANTYTSISIIDLTGKEILKKEIAKTDNKVSLDVTKLTNATYIIKLQGDNGSMVRKFVKE
jgi:hypothetical protein